MDTTSVAVQGSGITSYFWLLLIAAAVAILTRKIRAPYALALVVTGLLVGVPRLFPSVRLDPQTLFTIFLPPLLFESAIHLRVAPLKKDALPIGIFALGGTFVSTLIVGFLSARFLNLPLPSALVFGALISATDPISVIAVFKQLGAGKRLTLLMESESLFNDGVAVVLFGVFLDYATGGTLTVGGSFARFFLSAAGGIAVGVAWGAVAAWLTRGFDEHLLEITLTALVAFGAYLSAETLHVSGVIATVAAGMVVGNYGMPRSMSPSTRLSVIAFWEFAAFIVNSIVFLIVGIEVSAVNLLHRPLLVLGAAGCVLAGRASIYPLAFIANRLSALRRDSEPVSGSYQHVLFWGGLRGALSMALALGLASDFPGRSEIVTATFGVVLFSLLVQGTTIGPLLRRLNLAQVQAKEYAQEHLKAERIASQAALSELDRLEASAPDWAIQSLQKEYVARLDAASEGEHAYTADERARDGAEVRRLALRAEREAVSAAAREGHLDEDEAQRYTASIDTQIIALQAASIP